MITAPKVVGLGEACCGCGACAAACRTGCLVMERDCEGFLRPCVDVSLCVGCGRCDAVCPSLGLRGTTEPIEVLWAKSRSEELLDASSSGGLFGILGRYVIAGGGIVVGAAFVDGCKRIEHCIAEDREGLARLQRSKYVQSIVPVDVYLRTAHALKEGRRVLFAGTACQVSGMRNYLGKLVNGGLFLSLDVICHGVPSPLLWEKWLEHRSSIEGYEIDEVNFRSKTTGWSSYSVLYYVRTEKGASCAFGGRYGDDWYMRAFLDNASLRPSCYSCPAKRACGSDVTLGDFWGFQALHPDIDSSKGVSAVLCNTERGTAFVHAALGETEHGEATYAEIAKGNPALEVSAAPHPERAAFMGALASGVSVKDMSRRWSFRDPFLSRAKSKLKRLLRH